MKQNAHHERRWKVAIACFFVAFVIATAATMFVAAGRVSPVVDADYYVHGLHYHSKPANWALAASLRGDALQVKVSDENGAPMSGGRLEYRLETANAPSTSPLLLRESAPGTYVANCATSGGDLHGALRFSKGGETISKKMVLLH